MSEDYAFPCDNISSQRGMTLRDYFAAKALAGLLTQYATRDEDDPTEYSQLSYKYADAMLKARVPK